MTEQEQDRVEINWVQVSASALAAVSSAVLLSTVGVAGTIIGAAVGSVVATAGSAIYSYYLRITHERVAQAQAAALDRVARARAGASGVWADTRRAEAREQRTQLLRAQRQAEEAGEELDEAERELDDVQEDAARADLARGPGRPALEADRGRRRGDLRGRDAGDPDLRAGHRPGRVHATPAAPTAGARTSIPGTRSPQGLDDADADPVGQTRPTPRRRRRRRGSRPRRAARRRRASPRRPRRRPLRPRRRRPPPPRRRRRRPRRPRRRDTGPTPTPAQTPAG